MGLLDGILGNVLGGLTRGGGIGGMGGGMGGALRPNDDNPLGAALGRAGGGMAASALMALAFRVLQQNGGITGLIDKLRQSGLGSQASSWVGTGDNLPVSGDQLRNALGPGQLEQIASHFGITQDQATSGLAQVLPELVNQMTPAGEVPDDHQDMISQALSMLTRRGV